MTYRVYVQFSIIESAVGATEHWFQWTSHVLCSVISQLGRKEQPCMASSIRASS